MDSFERAWATGPITDTYREEYSTSPGGSLFSLSLPGSTTAVTLPPAMPSPSGSRSMTPPGMARTPIDSSPASLPSNSIMNPESRDHEGSPLPEQFFASGPGDLFGSPSPMTPDNNIQSGQGANHYPFASVPQRLPPILQVEKKQVTTSATQMASAQRRRNEATFSCPVPDCGSTFTRRFNLRGHLRSHTEERPYVCEFRDCNKSFARQHDCKRHMALHDTDKAQHNICKGCNKSFSRTDALNRHLRSTGGEVCRIKINGPPASAPPPIHPIEAVMFRPPPPIIAHHP